MIKLELDVLIIDTFFLGSLEYSPESVIVVILGTLILKVEFVEIPAARIPPLLTSVILWPTATKVKVWPLADMLLTRL